MKYLKSYTRFITEGISNEIDMDKLLPFIQQKLKINKFTKLGEGMNGIAYIIDNNKKVLKITKDKSEAIESAKIKGKTMKHIADVYNVFALKNEFDGIYVIILEYLKISDSINDNIKKINKLFSKEMGFAEFLDEYAVDMISKDNVNTVLSKAKKKDLDNFLIQYLNIIDEFKSNNIKSIDYVNPDNLGFKPDGSLAVFDLGYGDEHGQELAYLERNQHKILKNRKA